MFSLDLTKANANSRGMIFLTLPKTNIAPDRRPSQKENHLPTLVFQVRVVSFREGKLETSETKPGEEKMLITFEKSRCSL